MSSTLSVLAIEPYSVTSHRLFLEGYRRHSRHDVVIWQLPPERWKWRMRGAAYHFAARAAQELRSTRPDVVLASDYLNLSDWRALCPAGLRDIPAVVYFHENQITFPLADHAPADHHYGWINLSSALAAERVLFNSHHHRDAFLAATERVLRRMPGPLPSDMVETLAGRSGVFPVGIDFTLHDRVLAGRTAPSAGDPVILWNHRWEYDKGPDRFTAALLALKKRGTRFRLVVCGHAPARSRTSLEELQRELGERIDHLGFIAETEPYLRTVAGADIVVSTARHEFFGVSVVEAMYLGCLPVLPAALSYPEIIPERLHRLFLYGADGFEAFLDRFLEQLPRERVEDVRAAAARFDWRRQAPRLDAILGEVARAPR